MTELMRICRTWWTETFSLWWCRCDSSISIASTIIIIRLTQFARINRFTHCAVFRCFSRLFLFHFVCILIRRHSMQNVVDWKAHSMWQRWIAFALNFRAQAHHRRNVSISGEGNARYAARFIAWDVKMKEAESDCARSGDEIIIDAPKMLVELFIKDASIPFGRRQVYNVRNSHRTTFAYYVVRCASLSACVCVFRGSLSANERREHFQRDDRIAAWAYGSGVVYSNVDSLNSQNGSVLYLLYAVSVLQKCVHI